MIRAMWTRSIRVWTWTVALAAMIAAARAEGSVIALPAEGYTAVDVLTADSVKNFCVFGDDLAIYTNANGLQIVDRDDPAVRQSWGKPSDYLSYYAAAGIWTSFVAPDPSGQSLWVGFTISNNSDDRIYQVDSSGTWTHQATLKGNFDMEFHAGSTYVSANPGASGSSGPGESSVYLFDTTGGGQHEVLAKVGGHSAGLAVDASGNVYCGTHYSDGQDNRIARFTAAQMAAAVGSDPLTLSDAEELFALSAGPYDLDIDAGNHLVFSARGFTGGNYLAVWDEEDGRQITQLAASIGTSSAYRFTLFSTIGDVTSGGGMVLANNSYQKGIAEVIRLLPGDADGNGIVDQADAAVLAENWGETNGMSWADGDFNEDGAVSAADASILAANWGQSLWPAGEAASTPEPAIFSLFVGAVATLAARRSSSTAKARKMRSDGATSH